MNAAKVVVHEVKRQRSLVVDNLFRERIGQAREAAHGHTHGKILPLDIGR